MKKTYFALLFYFTLLIYTNLAESDDVEPHAYTISFFQFDPKDIGVGSDATKKQSKKDIKPSDIEKTPKHNTTKELKQNSTDMYSNLTEVKTNYNGTSDLDKVKKWKDITNSSQVVITNKSAINNATNNSSTQGSNTNSSTVNITNSTKPLLQQNNQTVNLTKINNNTTNINSSLVNVTNAAKRITIVHPVKHARKKDTLNPNPQPSLQQAEQNLNLPSNHIQAITTPNFKPKVLFEKNKTAVEHTKNSDSQIANSQKLLKTGEGYHAPKPVKNGGKTNTTVKDDKLSKLEKDKKRNEEIQANAKKIHPIVNLVDIKPVDILHPVIPQANIRNPVVDKSTQSNPVNKKQTIHNTVEKNLKNHTLTGKVVATKNDTLLKALTSKKSTNEKKTPKKNTTITNDVNTKTSEDQNVKVELKNHREEAKKLLPNYAESKLDHNLNFQIGSLKHPKHDIFPKCHQCSNNSTFSSCVKKSTLVSCNQDLSNICYTRSFKHGDDIRYQMGCTDHRNCSVARAYPCKDGSKHCFTCCQFDECNSSPHHGDFELDELNLEELKLDSSSGSTNTIIASWNHVFVLSLVTLATTKLLW